MNAIEMAVKAMLEKALVNLTDRLPDLIASLPPEIIDNIRQGAQVAISLKAQLDRIENQNRLIIAHLNIPDGVNPDPAPKNMELLNGKSERLSE